MRNRKTYRRLNTIGEIILAPLSFLFYRIVRFAVQRLVQLSGRVHAREAARWQILEGGTVRKPFNLLALMTSAPRWNTHALIALAGPFHVQNAFNVHVAAAAKSAQSWTIVVHAEPQHRIVASIGSLSASGEEPWQSVRVNPGTYRLALRYYHCTEPAELPAIEVDSILALPAIAVPAHTNDFYNDLSKQSNFFYLCLHSYVCTLLRYRSRFARSFVEREYLPAGNPQTTFYYGFLASGARLVFELDSGLLQTHDIYFTAYNRASFPIQWYPLLESRHITAPSQVSGSYLIRVHSRTPTPGVFDRSWLRIHAQVTDASGKERQTVGV